MHWVQYGRLRSHFTLRRRQVKQSSAAPPAWVRRRRFLGGGAATAVLGSADGAGEGGMTADVILTLEGCTALEMDTARAGSKKALGRTRLEGSSREIVEQPAPEALNCLKDGAARRTACSLPIVPESVGQRYQCARVRAGEPSDELISVATLPAEFAIVELT